MSLFNLSAALNALSTDIVTVRRPGAAVFDGNGILIPLTFTTFSNVRTPFQNMRGDSLKHFPEGDRTKAWIKLWPQMQLVVGDRIDSTKGTYIVQKVDECVDEGNFTAAYARKLGDGES